MMEISEKSSFRFKALVVALIAAIITSTCGSVFGASLIAKEENEPGLNRKVTFTGKTYWRSDGQGRKLSIFKRGEKVRKDYGDGEGCGIITVVELRDVPYPYYVFGEGWISADQIVDATKYISLKFEKTEDGLNAKLHVDGEYIEITSDNNAVIGIEEGGILCAKADGETVVTFHKPNGEDIEVVAVVYDGNIELNIPEKSASAELTEATISFVDETVVVSASGSAEAGLEIEGGTVTVNASGEGEATLTVKDQEIAKIEADGDFTVTADLENLSLTADVNEANQKLTILEQMTIGLRETAHAEIDREHVGAEGDAGVLVNDNEIAGANARINYNYGDEDPTGEAGVRVMGNEVISTGEKTIPVISGMKALIGQLGNMGSIGSLGNLGNVGNLAGTLGNLGNLAGNLGNVTDMAGELGNVAGALGNLMGNLSNIAH